MMLAELSSDQIISILINAAIATTGILTVIFMRGKQKVGVSFDFVPADKKEFDREIEKNEVEHKLMAEKIIAIKKEVDVHLSSRAKTIFDKIDQNTGALRLEMRQQTDRRDEAMDKLRTELESKIESVNANVTETMRTMPNEIVTLLRNTKGLM